jgi:hypothetical protein
LVLRPPDFLIAAIGLLALHLSARRPASEPSAQAAALPTVTPLSPTSTPNPSATIVTYDANGILCDLPPIDVDREFCGIDFSASSPDERNQPNETYGLHSPDGAWLASPCDNVSGYSLDGFDQQSPENWQVIFGSDAVKKYGCTGYFFPKHWTLNNRYLYYAANRTGSNASSAFAWEDHALLRLDITDGESTEILPSTAAGQNFYAFTVSPDGLKLASVTHPASPLVLAIAPLPQGTLGKAVQLLLDKKLCAAGAIVWSPDSQKLLYAGWHCSSQAGSDGLYSLMLVDVVLHAQHVIFSEMPQAYFPLRRDASGPVVRYSGPDGDTTAAGYYRFEVQTGALTRINITDLNPVLLFSN